MTKFGLFSKYTISENIKQKRGKIPRLRIFRDKLFLICEGLFD